MKLLKPIGRFVARSLNLPLDKWDALLDAMEVGPTSSGVYISEHGAWNQATVFSCIRLLQGDLARHPIHVYRKVGDNIERQAGHPVEVLLKEPNPINTGMQFRGYLWSTRLSWGNCFAQKITNGRGEVIELWPLEPNRMTKVERSGTARRYEYSLPGGETKVMTGAEVFHDQETISKDGGITGVSPIRQLTEPIALALYGERHASSYFRNYGRPNILLKHPSHFQDKDARAAFLKGIKEAWTGSNAMGIGLLEDGLDVMPLSMPHTDAQLLETRRFEKQEIAQVFGVPMHRLADQEQRAQTSVEQNAREYVEYTLAPLATSHEQALARHLLSRQERASGFFLRHNLDALLRGQFRERMEGWTKATGAHPMTINEARAKEDLPRLEGGDRVMVPLAMAFLGEDGQVIVPPKPDQGSTPNVQE